MTRFLIFLVVSILLSRVFWRIVGSFMDGLKGRDSTPAGPPRHSVPMARDPVCGTFVLPERAVTLSVGRERLSFCSEACRDTYRARTA